MTYDYLHIQSDNDILTLTINREKALNALNTQTMLELDHFFSQTAHDLPNVKGIIITGAGDKAFVAGADITEFLALDAAKAAMMAKRGQDIFFRIENFPKPVIALVNGFALGGGCELAMACHLRIATDNASFGQPEVNLGLIPGYGGTQRLIQYIGKAKAMELLMTADMIKAPEALRLGLVNDVLPKDEALEKARALIEKIATKSPLAIAAVIRTVNDYYRDGINGFDTEIREFGYCAGTSDFREGATAFVEKRKPVFKGI